MMVITISGPSGSGKSTIARALCAYDRGFSEIVSVTTRPAREGEKYKVDYRFVAEQVFLEYHKANLFLETTKYDGYLYGALKCDIEEAIALERDVLLVCNFDGMQQIASSPYESVSVFIMPPSKEVLLKRLQDRSVSEREVRHRLAIVEDECAQSDAYDYVFESVGKSVEMLADEIGGVIIHRRTEAWLR